MIKLTRGECPPELTREVKEELTRLYAQNNEREVWSSSKIKKPLKDVTIDHFLPKSKNPDKVVEWDNLLPACLRCNRNKKDKENRIVNPCEEEPKKFLAVKKGNPFCMKGIDADGVGHETIQSVGLNDMERVIMARKTEWEEIQKWLRYIHDNMQEKPHERHREQLLGLMKKCTFDNSYSAVKATNMLLDETYANIKEMLQEEGAWTERFEETESQMKSIALQVV